MSHQLQHLYQERRHNFITTRGRQRKQELKNKYLKLYKDISKLQRNLLEDLEILKILLETKKLKIND